MVEYQDQVAVVPGLVELLLVVVVDTDAKVRQNFVTNTFSRLAKLTCGIESADPEKTPPPE